MSVTALSIGTAPLVDGLDSASEPQCEAARSGTFVAITWNACGMEDGAVNDVVSQLDGDTPWDAFLLQEGPCAEQSTYKISDGGHFSRSFPCPSSPSV